MEREVIKTCIKEILIENGKNIEFNEDTKLVDELGLSSLDLAELVASLELELDVDPFANGASIASIVTVKDLCEVYEKCVK